MIRRVNSTIGSLFSRSLDILAVIAGLLVVFITVAVVSDVVMRFFLNRPMPWVLEATEYSLLYMTFLGAAWLLKKDGHVKIDIVLNCLRTREHNLLSGFNSIIVGLICLVLFWYGSTLTLEYFREGFLSVRHYALPKWVFLVIIPVGSLMLFVESMRRAVWHFQSAFSAKMRSHKPG